jgi:uncharacterized protein YkwD
MKPWLLAIGVGVLVALSSCGPRATHAPPMPVPQPGSSELASVLALVNEARARGGDCGPHGVFAPTHPVRWEPRLAVAAEQHARDLRDNVGTGSHTGSDGSDVVERVERTGYRWSWVAENVAWSVGGEMTPDEVVAGWLASPGHCRNILSPNFPETGVGKAGAYWVQVFAAPQH